MFKRLMLFSLVAAALAFVVWAPSAGAAEQKLADVTLGQSALDLLDQNDYGPPPFFGPLGATVSWGIVGSAGAPAARAVSTGYGGGARPAGPAAGPVETQPVLYWLYNKPGAQVVLGFDSSGKLLSVVVTGRSWSGAVTEGGIRLGDGYTEVLDKYGFPDSTGGAGGNLVLRYTNAGLTLNFSGLRVIAISLAKPAPLAPAGAFGTARPGVPSFGPPAAAAPPGAGAMSFQERQRQLAGEE